MYVLQDGVDGYERVGESDRYEIDHALSEGSAVYVADRYARHHDTRWNGTTPLGVRECIYDRVGDGTRGLAGRYYFGGLHFDARRRTGGEPLRVGPGAGRLGRRRDGRRLRGERVVRRGRDRDRHLGERDRDRAVARRSRRSRNGRGRVTDTDRDRGPVSRRRYAAARLNSVVTSASVTAPSPLKSNSSGLSWTAALS